MALTAGRNLQSKNTKLKSFPMAASTQVYRGGFAMISPAGFAVPAALTAANHGCVGVFHEDKLSGAGENPEVLVEVGEFKVPAQTVAQTAVGEIAYADDDETAEDDAAATTNAPCLGVITRRESDSEIWVEMSPTNGKLAGPHA